MSAVVQDLEVFLNASVRGIVDQPDHVKIESIQSGSRTVTLIVRCDPNDLKFLYSKMRAIKFIAIGIAQRHKFIVNILVNE